jgi:Sec-independent protein translocase protein TatA
MSEITTNPFNAITNTSLEVTAPGTALDISKQQGTPIAASTNSAQRGENQPVKLPAIKGNVQVSEQQNDTLRHFASLGLDFKQLPASSIIGMNELVNSLASDPNESTKNMLLMLNALTDPEKKHVIKGLEHIIAQEKQHNPQLQKLGNELTILLGSENPDKEKADAKLKETIGTYNNIMNGNASFEEKQSAMLQMILLMLKLSIESRESNRELREISVDAVKKGIEGQAGSLMGQAIAAISIAVIAGVLSFGGAALSAVFSGVTAAIGGVMSTMSQTSNTATSATMSALDSSKKGLEATTEEDNHNKTKDAEQRDTQEKNASNLQDLLARVKRAQVDANNEIVKRL